MHEIATRLLKTAGKIEKSVKGSVRRAKVPSCKKLNAQLTLTRIMELTERIKTDIKEKILKTVEVCGDSCLTLSFEKEVNPLVESLKKSSKQAKGLARKVLKCSGGGQQGGGGAKSSTKDKLNSVIGDTKNIVTNCTVCPHP